MAKTALWKEERTEAFSIQEVARRSGFSEPTLRYYERVGLIASIPRDPSSGHRRYDADTLQTIEALACLRSCGFSISEMHTYLGLMKQGNEVASEQRELFERHAAKLAEEMGRLQVRLRYMKAKVDLWGARERGDEVAENDAIGELKEMRGTEIMKAKVLVTGGSGFVGAHTIVQLIEAGYDVKTTVRSLKRESDVRAMLKRAGCEPGESLAFVEADLTSDEGWPQAVQECDYVLHVASPFPSGAPKHEDELIVPAREGALRVLRAAREAGVKRVVLTSSFAAVGYSQPAKEGAYTEEDWTDIETPGLGAYIKSKTIAERAAWEFIEREGGDLELAVINPVGIFGPVLGTDYSSSIQLIKRLLDGEVMPMANFPFGVVDVRDVADLHLRAMTHPAAKGERFLAVAGDSVNLQKIAHILKARLGDMAAHVAEQVDAESGTTQKISNAKAKAILGWTPRSNEEALVISAESLVQLGVQSSPLI